MKRNETRKIQIGQISIGGSEHVVIQSMCSIKTSKIEEVSAQINRCASLGAELMRCSVLDFEDAVFRQEATLKVVHAHRLLLVARCHDGHLWSLEWDSGCAPTHCIPEAAI